MSQRIPVAPSGSRYYAWRDGQGYWRVFCERCKPPGVSVEAQTVPDLSAFPPANWLSACEGCGLAVDIVK